MCNFSDNSLPLGFGGMAKYAGPVMHTIGLAPVAETNFYEAYPNPTSGVFNIKMDKIFAGSILKVTDVLGKEVYSKTFEINQHNEEIKIDLSGFSKGVYLLNLTSGKSSVSKKIILD